MGTLRSRFISAIDVVDGQDREEVIVKRRKDIKPLLITLALIWGVVWGKDEKQ